MLTKCLFLSLLMFAVPQGVGWSQSVDFESSTYMPLKRDSIGVASVPGILPSTEDEVKKTRPVIVRTNPSKNASLLIKLQTRRDLETRETRYEGGDAVVYEIQDGWFRVRTKAGMGWISKSDAGDFTPTAQLVHYGYLTPEWDGVLYQEPSTTSKHVPIRWIAKNYPNEGDRPGMNVKTFLVKEGTTWIQITLSTEIPCSGDLCLRKPVTGWVRAYSKTGFLIVWFDPKGC